MTLPDNDYHILRLTNAFYKEYPNPPYRENLQKNQRAYNCLLFQTHYDYFICIPYRSEISHKIFCSKCGNQLSLDTKFCPNCGQKVELSSEIQTHSKDALQDLGLHIMLHLI